MKTRGEIIREKRHEMGWSLTQLSLKTGADPSTISKWETQNRKPNKKFVKKLVKLFNCTVGELFGYEREQDL